jgi:hypothetical protein
MRDFAKVYLAVLGIAASVLLLGLLFFSILLGEHVFILALLTCVCIPILYWLTDGFEL